MGPKADDILDLNIDCAKAINPIRAPKIPNIVATTNDATF